MEFMSSLQSGLDDNKPSLFEILSEQQLSALIPPSLRYLLAVATHRHPRYLLRLLNSFDEVYAMLMLAVERHYLVTYGGGFTENFYGMKRERVLWIKGGEAPRTQAAVPSLMRETLKLRTGDIWKNLAIMVGLPYVKRKLDESYDIHVPQTQLLGPTYNRNLLPPDATFRQRIIFYYKWFLRNIYPSVNAAYYFSLLVFNLAYLFDNTKYSSPFLWLTGTRIRRMGEADYRAIAQNLQPPRAIPAASGARPGQSSSIFHPRIFMTTIFPRLLSSLKILLPTSIFALKFLEWWHASDFARQLTRKAAEGFDLPPPIISGLPSLKAPITKPSAMKSPTSALEPTALTKADRPSSTTITTNTVSLSSPQSHSSTSPSTNTTTPSPPPTHLTTSTRASTKKPTPPISSITHLPILTVPPPTPNALSSGLCPICLHPIQTPTAAQTGYVFCYTCIFKWVSGEHERQEAFMEGRTNNWVEEGEGGWREKGGVDGKEAGSDDGADEEVEDEGKGTGENRVGEWESGKGRCAVTGRRVLGGTEGLRRVMV
ncbi:ubiquitin-protein ligase peroxin 12 [Bachmanniomyces sp. S44760]|nr:ubiquitin-protein ligase peroxin 12 [Bachmanniomyces sp. S44760]